MKQQLSNYELYGQTEESKEYLLKNFEKKIQNVNGVGPFINQLKDMYKKFREGHRELILIGSALLYFVLPADVIPDYIFPIGYIDDAMAVQIVSSLMD